MKPAKFTYGNGIFYPADKAAIAATAIVSKRFIREHDMILVRCAGYVPYYLNGQEIGKVDVRV